MILAALFLNIAVLTPVLAGLIQGRPWVEPVYGGDTPARRILVCVYAAIAGLSLVLLVWSEVRMVLALGLLVVQIAYKLLTLPAIGTHHPVGRANLGIAAFHVLALGSLL